MSDFRKFALTTLLVLVGAVGLLMSMCGAGFTFAAIAGMVSSSSTEGSAYASAMLVISVPSLVIGGLTCGWVVRWLRRARARVGT